MTLLSHQMLRGSRQYIIDKAKKPLMKAIVTLSKRYVNPTRENCMHPNSLILLDKGEKFFELENNPNRIELFEALFRLVIVEYEHDPYYRSRMDWFLEELVEEVMSGNWQPRMMGRPISFWNEPEPYGLYEGRKFKELIKC